MKPVETFQIQFDFGEAIPIIQTQVVKSSSKETGKSIFEFMDMLAAPIITFSSSWTDAIPHNLKQDIKLSRLIGGRKNEEMATIPETVAYIMTRTYEAPMSHEWANIYIWCSAHYLKQFRNKTDNDLKDVEPPEKLSEYEESLLKRLRVWIYEKRRECVKQQMKQSTQTNSKNDNSN